jgi:hypothetical protein
MEDPIPLQAQLAAAQEALIAAETRRYKVEPPPVLMGDDTDRWDLDLWFFGIEIWLQACGVTVTRVACAATATRFGKHALRWWQDKKIANDNPYDDWELFKCDLKAYLLPQELLVKARKELYRTYQYHNESTLNYVTRFRAKKARVPDLSPAEELYVFCNGLVKRLQQEVARDAPATLDEAIKVALRLANVYELDPRGDRGMGRGHRNEGPARSSRFSSAYSGPVPMELGMMRGNNRGRRQPKNNNRGLQMPPAELKRHLDNKLCFRCHKPGHQARQCKG